jgi:uncharacterized protein
MRQRTRQAWIVECGEDGVSGLDGSGALPFLMYILTFAIADAPQRDHIARRGAGFRRWELPMDHREDERAAPTAPEATTRPFRVLSLDGGGMRGTYTATYIDQVASAFAKRRNVGRLDVGAAFDLIVGTSTGAIIACALAAGTPLAKVVELYREHGRQIFERRLPTGLNLGLAADLVKRPGALARGEARLRGALADVLGTITLAEIYERRRIALAITAVEMTQHRSWVFKTPHMPGTNHRDDGYSLVDVCLATSAAPIYRSLAALDHPEGGDGYNVFADGGLWANNPVLVALIEALELAPPDRPIEIFCLGTCPLPAGEQIPRAEVHRGLGQWQFGGAAASLSIDAQEFAYDNMARMLAKHVGRPCRIVRFPSEQTPAALMPHLDLDDSSEAAALALINQARTDADMTNSRCARPDDADGQLICQLFADAPPVTPSPQTLKD